MVMSRRPVKTIAEFSQGLIGKSCWSTIAGVGTGSMVTLAFGEKVRRRKSVRNPMLTQEEREFEGEFVIFIKDSEWRLSNGDMAICTSDDSNEANGLMLSGLQGLVGRTVVAMRTINDRGGLKLDFNEGWNIQLSGVDRLAELDNYSLFYRGSLIGDDGSRTRRDDY